ncbi:kinetochore protein NDC80 homolog [Ptychodera flava]|uniref:kinetochore protein NDC80 homolog n=1 Tax=Ptychodera flava TaxID=63121 RepID=UPI003969CFED
MQKPSFGWSGTRSSFGGSRRSSTGGRTSIGPLRVRNESGALTRSASRDRGNVGGQSSTKRRSSSTSGKPSSARKSHIPRFGLGASSVRRSSAYGTSSASYGSSGIVKDTRPLNNKEYMKQCIRTLIEFLSENGYGHALSPKQLITPTTKEIVSIFEFLFSFINYHSNLHGSNVKFEDEIPKRLKQLGYPININKSAMFTMGSPHTWPHILGAIMWLLDFVKTALSLDVESLMFQSEGFDDADDSRFLFSYLEKCYEDFMNGQDDFDTHERMLAENMKIGNHIATEDLDQLENDIRGLNAELEMLELEPDKMASLNDRKQLLQTDLKRFENYLQELESHKRSLSLRQQEKDEDFQRAVLEEKQQLEEIQHLQHIYDTQELSAADVERINREKRDLTRHVEALEKEKEEIDKQIWNEEMEISRQHEEAENHVQEYNNQARQLKLIPPTAENAHGIDYEMRTQVHNQHPDFAGIVDFAGTIKPALIQVKKQVSDAVHETQNRMISEEEACDQLMDMVNERKEEVEMFTTKLRRLEVDVESVRERTNQDCRKKQDELQELLQEVQNLKTQQQMTVEDAERDLHEFKKKCEKDAAGMDADLQSYGYFLVEATRLIFQHHSDIVEHIAKLNRKAEAMLRQAKSFQVPELNLPDPDS